MNANTESKDLEVSGKKELTGAEEKTVPGRFFVPDTDITETEDALRVVMDMPGVARDRVDVKLEKNVLTIEGMIDTKAYEGMRPVYTEYPLGHYTRSFSLSREIDQERISASMDDGVLTLLLPKVVEAKPRRIAID